jgi:hypothetical protein
MIAGAVGLNARSTRILNPEIGGAMDVVPTNVV